MFETSQLRPSIRRFVLKRNESKRRRLCLETLEDRLAPATFTVRSTDDAGVGSLRQAILSANSTSAADTVTFAIAGAGAKTINLLSALPAVTSRLTINGATQGVSATPLIELNGTSAGASANGLTLVASGSVVRGLTINRFSGNGIRVQGAGCIIAGCFIGTNSAGSAAASNVGYGVLLTSAGNRIGGTGATDGNLISGNGKGGVVLLGIAAKGNRVLGNVIGLNASGAAALGNRLGVWVTGGAAANTIGGASANTISGNLTEGVAFTGLNTKSNTLSNNRIGTDPAGNAARANGSGGVLIDAAASANVVFNNTISGNTGNGVSLSGTGVAANQIRGNRIGLNAGGTAIVANTLSGVRIGEGASGNVIGGATAVLRNVISGNQRHGIDIDGAGSTKTQVLGNFIGVDATGAIDLGNSVDGVRIAGGASNTIVGGTSAAVRNVISGNNGQGVEITGVGTVGNKVQGNLIGTDVTGVVDTGNAIRGVFIDAGASNNLVGGTVAGARNVLSGNSSDGVRISGIGSTSNVVQGNFIGTDVTGKIDRGNSGDGVQVTNGATNNLIGGDTAAARNLISGNGDDGIQISLVGTTGNKVQGNFVGTDVTGKVDLGNSDTGVVFSDGASNNFLGGLSASVRNIVSGNDDNGVELFNAGTGNFVQGNFIGTDVTGAADLGNLGVGVRLASGTSNNTVGGTVAVARNVIAGNDEDGVQIDGAAISTTGNVVQGNFIGVAANGTAALANNRHGVFITGAAASNVIGGTIAGAGNLIANNGGDGVLIGSDPGAGFSTAAGSGNSVLSNRIFNNSGLGIDLGANDGVTVNDGNDPDTGPNDLLNCPVLNTALVLGDVLYLSGLINTQNNKQLRIEFFMSPSGAQGQIFVGFILVESVANIASFTRAFKVPGVQPGQVVTATATDELGNTSEFSPALAIG